MFTRAYHLPGPESITWNDFHRRAAAAIGAPAPVLVHIPTDILHRLAPDRAAISVENFQNNNCFDATAARTPTEQLRELIHGDARDLLLRSLLPADLPFALALDWLPPDGALAYLPTYWIEIH